MLQLRGAVRALCRAPLSRCPPAPAAPPRHVPPAAAALQARHFASLKSTLASMAGSVADPFIASVFKAIRRNESLELRLAEFSRRFPDWEGPAAFVEGCGSALQALMELTNSRFPPPPLP